MFLPAFQYKQWSDRRAVAAIRRIDGGRFAAAAAFARQQLNHMVIVEELFKARLRGAAAPHEATNTALVPELEELERRLEASNHWFLQYVRDPPADAGEQAVPFIFVDGKRGAMTRQEILFHIVNHGTYHRGAIGHALDLAQVAHPADTYTVFIHAAEPDRRLGAQAMGA